MSNAALADTFSEYFVMPADQPDLRSAAYRIRYEVYCREFEYEPLEAFPDGLERDEFDQQSLHSLLVHRKTESPVGCIRLIVPSPSAPDVPLPFEVSCGPAIDRVRFNVDSMRGRYGEISRLAVLKSFRRRITDANKPFSLTEQDYHLFVTYRRNFPFIPISLMLCALARFLMTELDVVLALMEPALMRLFDRFGIVFTQVGETVDHRGMRAPCVMHREEVLAHLQPDVYALMRAIALQISLGDGERGRSARRLDVS